MKKFEIWYVDPETGEKIVVEKEFNDLPEFPAKVCAEDYAYAKADKGHYGVRELLT